jgi:DNA-binding transcriptional MerR regulator
MKDLCELTGLSRQVVHFYISQGLLQKGHKTGRNMAYYGEEHLQRLRTIRTLQEERFLPLRAIRAVFTDGDGAFTTAQRRLLTEVKQRLQPKLGTPEGPRRTRPLRPLLQQTGVSAAEVDQIVAMGLLAVGKGAGGQPVIAEDDAWAIELWGQLRAAGFTPSLGFGPQDLAIFEDAISTLFTRETHMLTRRLAHLPAAEVATMIERALPLINSYLWRSHDAKVRNFLSAL